MVTRKRTNERRVSFSAKAPALLARGAVCAALGCLLVITTSCQRCGDDTQPTADGSTPMHAAQLASEAAKQASIQARTRALVRIENTRDIKQISPSDIAHPSALVRASAMRALARADSDETTELLATGLSDIDAQVVAWAAFGLGERCRTASGAVANQITARLAIRGASWSMENTLTSDMMRPRKDDKKSENRTSNGAAPAPVDSCGAPIDVWMGLSHGLGQCGTDAAQGTLSAWLSGSSNRGAYASFSLGRITQRTGRISEETATMLLRAASGDTANPMLPQALYPLARVKQAPVRLQDQLLQACIKQLEKPGDEAVFVLRALGAFGNHGVEPLANVLRSTTGFTPPQMAQAARSLGIIASKQAKKALIDSLASLVPPADAASLSALVGPHFGTLLTALQTLDSLDSVPPSSVQNDSLEQLAKLPIPPKAPATVRRRVVTLRCAAARVLARDRYDYRLLRTCDPDDTAIGQLARLVVIGRGTLTKEREKEWETYLSDARPPWVRQAALQLLAQHPEAKTTSKHVERALSDKHVAMVTEAALLVAQFPERFVVASSARSDASSDVSTKNENDAFKPDPNIIKSLENAAKRTWPPDLIETRGALARAAGALGVVSMQPWIESLCTTQNPSLTKHAKAALSALRTGSQQCSSTGQTPLSPAPELDRLLTEPKTIVFDSDVGQLRIHLDPSLSPVACTRVAELVASKFYDGLTVHRVVPGFVVQFGDHDQGGYGGAARRPLRCELSPKPFGPYMVGMAHSGKDTASSQLFVTLAPSPHLDGVYSWIGTASGPWDTVMQGDRIRKATLE